MERKEIKNHPRKLSSIHKCILHLKPSFIRRTFGSTSTTRYSVPTSATKQPILFYLSHTRKNKINTASKSIPKRYKNVASLIIQSRLHNRWIISLGYSAAREKFEIQNARYRQVYLGINEP